MKIMNRLPQFVLVAILVLAMVGCSKSNNSNTTSESSGSSGPVASVNSSASTNGTEVAARSQDNGPASAVFGFLEAVRVGNNDQANKMLTPLARQKLAEHHMVAAPPGSTTAKFELGEIQYLSDDGARVVIKWTDMDENNKPRTDQVIWMVRKVEEGWRVAGVAAPIFEGEPPVLLNFEDPEDMIHQQQMVRDEIRRRMEAEHQPTEQNTASAAGADTQSQPSTHAENPVVR